MSLIKVKEDPEWSASEARAVLYADHEVKNEMVLGPVLLQPPDMAYNCYGRQNVSADVKPEPLEPVDMTEAASKPFTSVHQPVKVEPKCETEEEEDVCLDQQIKRELLEAQLKEEFMSNGLNPKEAQVKQETQHNHPATPTYKENMPLGNCQPREDNILKKLITKSKTSVKNLSKITKSRQISSRSRIRYEEDSDTETEQAQVELTVVTVRKKKIHKCTYCSKVFPFRTGLTSHVRIHTGAKPYSCQVCSKRFSDYAVLIRHRKVHTGAKPHVCDTCGNRYSEKYLLKNHQRVHTGEQAYFCKDCPKTFINSSNYRRHQKVHMHKYTCDICKRRFSRKSTLATHIVNHAKPRRHACGECGARFGQRGHLARHLTRHLAAHGGGKLHACGGCKREFSQHSSLKKHLDRRVCERKRQLQGI